MLEGERCYPGIDRAITIGTAERVPGLKHVAWRMSSHSLCGLEQIAADPISLVGDYASTMGEDMTEAPPLPVLKRGRKRVSARRRARLSLPTAWNPESIQPVDIVAHDLYCTSLLLEYAAPLFPAEIVSGSAWVVRLQPPTGGGWVLELLSLVERWLESARLPCAKVLYGGRSYLIRTSTDIAQSRTATEVPAN